ncbi:MAG TPA: alpha/beta hydrolase [Casimicrobiaceae bacterium]|nr:alpha/beta hydrolase [Casimicrobiaceae bacterium]
MHELDPAVARILDGMRRNKTPALSTQPIEAARRTYDKGLRLLDLAPDPGIAARDLPPDPAAGHLPIREYLPAQRAPGALGGLLWLHGGGYCVGSIETSDIVCRMFAARCGFPVYSVGYRLAPEHPFPAAVDDALHAYRRVLQQLCEGATSSPRLAVGGDSAGGTLAAVVSLLARETGLPSPAAQVLVYPCTTGRRPSASKRRFAEGHFLTLRDVDGFYRNYTQGRDLDDDPRFAPVAARNLRAQPPSLIIAAQCDPLADDARAYADALAGAGNEVQHEVFPGMVHGFFNMGGVVPAALEAHTVAIRFLADAMPGPAAGAV